MLTVFHAPMSRSVRVLWLCEEMGMPYETAPASFREPSPEFRAANPLLAIPALRDGDVTMTESVAIMLYIMGEYGPTELAPQAGDPGYADYLQFLIFGEAGLCMNVNPIIAAMFMAPEADKQNWTVHNCTERFLKRVDYVDAKLAGRPFIAGDRFTAADISTGFGLGLADFIGVKDKLPPRAADYLARLRARQAYQRAAARP